MGGVDGREEGGHLGGGPLLTSRRMVRSYGGDELLDYSCN